MHINNQTLSSDGFTTRKLQRYLHGTPSLLNIGMIFAYFCLLSKNILGQHYTVFVMNGGSHLHLDCVKFLAHNSVQVQMFDKNEQAQNI